jgi:hypothetical protein
MKSDATARRRPRCSKLAGVAAFVLVFAEVVVPIGVLWWLAIPYYGTALARLSGGVLATFFSEPITAAWIRPEGTLNTASLLVFLFEGREIPFPIGLLVTNMIPYLALVVATPGLSVLRRHVILYTGAAILFLGHVLFIVLAFRFREFIGKHQDLPHAIAQFYLTIPFLLWIILAYWGKISRYFAENGPAGRKTDKAD